MTSMSSSSFICDSLLNLFTRLYADSRKVTFCVYKGPCMRTSALEIMSASFWFNPLDDHLVRYASWSGADFLCKKIHNWLQLHAVKYLKHRQKNASIVEIIYNNFYVLNGIFKTHTNVQNSVLEVIMAVFQVI